MGSSPAYPTTFLTRYVISLNGRHTANIELMLNFGFRVVKKRSSEFCLLAQLVRAASL